MGRFNEHFYDHKTGITMTEHVQLMEKRFYIQAEQVLRPQNWFHQNVEQIPCAQNQFYESRTDFTYIEQISEAWN